MLKKIRLLVTANCLSLVRWMSNVRSWLMKYRQ